MIISSNLLPVDDVTKSLRRSLRLPVQDRELNSCSHDPLIVSIHMQSPFCACITTHPKTVREASV